MTHHSLDPTPFSVHVASAMHSSGSYFHPCMTGPIVDRPMSHQDWHDEVCNWFGEESSVSSSYTNNSSETSTSDTACISSSSLDLSQTEHDRSLTVTAMSPLSRSLSLIRLMETCPLSTSFDVDPDTMNRPLTSSDMLSLCRTLSYSNLPGNFPPSRPQLRCFIHCSHSGGGSQRIYGHTRDPIGHTRDSIKSLMCTRMQFRVTPARIVFRSSNHPWKDLSSKLRKLDQTKLSSSLFSPSNRNNSIAINVRARSP